MDKSEKSSGKLVITGGDPSKEFGLLKKVLHKAAFFIQPPITRPGVKRVCLWGNAIVRAFKFNELTQLGTSIGFIGENTAALGVNAAEGIGGNSAIMGIPF